MCRPTTCPNCNHYTWTGCGQHIPIALGLIPKSKWCTCSHPANSTTSKDYPPMAGTGIPVK